MTAVGFEPTPFRNGALSHRLRPLGQTVLKNSAAVPCWPKAKHRNKRAHAPQFWARNSGTECPPRALWQSGGRARTSPPLCANLGGSQISTARAMIRSLSSHGLSALRGGGAACRDGRGLADSIKWSIDFDRNAASEERTGLASSEKGQLRGKPKVKEAGPVAHGGHNSFEPCQEKRAIARG